MRQLISFKTSYIAGIEISFGPNLGQIGILLLLELFYKVLAEGPIFLLHGLGGLGPEFTSGAAIVGRHITRIASV
jgi:hypothetical protein